MDAWRRQRDLDLAKVHRAEPDSELIADQHTAAVEARNWGTVAMHLIGARNAARESLAVKGTLELGEEQKAVLRRVTDYLGPLIHDVCKERDKWKAETKRLNKEIWG
jgi:hypothetical protein